MNAKWIAVAAVASMLGSGATAFAGVNCAQVNRYLQTGRTVQDVSETMVVPIEEVQKCQDEAKAAEGGAAAAPGAGEPPAEAAKTE